MDGNDNDDPNDDSNGLTIRALVWSDVARLVRMDERTPAAIAGPGTKEN